VEAAELVLLPGGVTISPQISGVLRGLLSCLFACYTSRQILFDRQFLQESDLSPWPSNTSFNTSSFI